MKREDIAKHYGLPDKPLSDFPSITFKPDTRRDRIGCLLWIIFCLLPLWFGALIAVIRQSK